jgi:hypothetical protein
VIQGLRKEEGGGYEMSLNEDTKKRLIEFIKSKMVEILGESLMVGREPTEEGVSRVLNVIVNDYLDKHEKNLSHEERMKWK